MILASWLMESAAEQAKLSCVHFFLTVIGRRISVQLALLCTKPCQHPPNATYTPGATHPFQNIDLTNTILAVMQSAAAPKHPFGTSGLGIRSLDEEVNMSIIRITPHSLHQQRIRRERLHN
jgi:hypothetical protein